MKKRALVFATIMMTAAMGMTAYAGQWQEDKNTGRSRYVEDDGSFATGWVWTDGNNDGIAECYYCGADGTNLNSYDEQTPDGCTLDEYGRWVVDGKVQTKVVGEQKTVPVEGKYYYMDFKYGANGSYEEMNKNRTLTVTRNADGSYHLAYALVGYNEEIPADDCTIYAGYLNKTELRTATDPDFGSYKSFEFFTNPETGKMEVLNYGWDAEHWVAE